MIAGCRKRNLLALQQAHQAKPIHRYALKTIHKLRQWAYDRQVVDVVAV